MVDGLRVKTGRSIATVRQRAEELIHGYLDGALNLARSLEVEHHEFARLM